MEIEADARTHARTDAFKISELKHLTMTFENIPQTVLAQLRGSYFGCIVIPLNPGIAGRQVPKPRCLSPSVNSLNPGIAGRQVPKPRCLSPSVNSLIPGIAGRQLPKPRCLSPSVNSLNSGIAGRQVPRPSCQ